MSTEISHAADKAEPFATVDAIRAFVRGIHRKVVSFVGYSAAGYEDPDGMLRHARHVLQRFDPATTLVNGGATAQGIGAVYAIAKERGFVTMGIVSRLALRERVPIAPHVDTVFYVDDETWGGRLPGSTQLSPTSLAIVTVSDVLVGIGGGNAARDELLAARAAGKDVMFIPADMNHAIAREKARKDGAAEPTDFSGAAHGALQETPPT